jgi:hypothetical protein
MKLSWWIVGTVAVVAGGVFVLKHFVDNKEELLPSMNNESEKKIGEFPSENPETEFDGSDFLI